MHNGSGKIVDKKRIVLLLLLLLVISISFVMNVVESGIYLSEKIKKPALTTLFKTFVPGNSAFLGQAIHDSYPPNISFVVPNGLMFKDNHFQKKRHSYFQEHLLKCFAYPIKIRLEDYQYTLSYNQFLVCLKFIKKSTLSYKASSFNLYLYESSEGPVSEMKLFVYMNNLMVLPAKMLKDGAG